MQSGPEQTCPKLGLREASGIRHTHLPCSRAVSPSLGAGGVGCLADPKTRNQGKPFRVWKCRDVRQRTPALKPPHPACHCPPLRSTVQSCRPGPQRPGLSFPERTTESLSNPLHPSCRKCAGTVSRSRPRGEQTPKHGYARGSPGLPSGLPDIPLPILKFRPRCPPGDGPRRWERSRTRGPSHGWDRRRQRQDRPHGFQRRTSPKNLRPQSGLGHRQGLWALLPHAPQPASPSPAPLLPPALATVRSVSGSRPNCVPTQVMQHRRRL